MKFDFIFKLVIISIACTISATTLYTSEALAFDPFGAALSVGNNIADRAERKQETEYRHQQEIAQQKQEEQQQRQQCYNNANGKQLSSGGFHLAEILAAIQSYLDEKQKLTDIDIENNKVILERLSAELEQKKSITTEYNNCLLDKQTTFFSKNGDFTDNKARYKVVTRKEKVSCTSRKVNDFGDTIEPKCSYREYNETVETSEQKKYNSKYDKEHSKWLLECSKDKEFSSSESLNELQTQIDRLNYNIKQYKVTVSEINKNANRIYSYAKDYVKLIKELWQMTAECTDWRKTNNISYSVAMDSMTTCQIFHNVIKWGNYKLYLDVCPTADSKLEF